MTTLVVRHTVEDFDRWSNGYKEHGTVRRSHGATGDRVLRDGNQVLALIDFPDEAAAAAFQADPSLGEAMHTAGVVGAPDISLWTENSQERY
jgi:hypothetical protein